MNPVKSTANPPGSATIEEEFKQCGSRLRVPDSANAHNVAVMAEHSAIAVLLVSAAMLIATPVAVLAHCPECFR